MIAGYLNLNVKQRIKQTNQNLTEDRYEGKAIPTRKANMYFNNLVGTKRLKRMLTFLVGNIGFFLIAIFSSILIAWKTTSTNILTINKKINIIIIFKLLRIRSGRRKRILTKIEADARLRCSLESLTIFVILRKIFFSCFINSHSHRDMTRP